MAQAESSSDRPATGYRPSFADVRPLIIEAVRQRLDPSVLRRLAVVLDPDEATATTDSAERMRSLMLAAMDRLKSSDRAGLLVLADPDRSNNDSWETRSREASGHLRQRRSPGDRSPGAANAPLDERHRQRITAKLFDRFTEALLVVVAEPLDAATDGSSFDPNTYDARSDSSYCITRWGTGQPLRPVNVQTVAGQRPQQAAWLDQSQYARKLRRYADKHGSLGYVVDFAVDNWETPATRTLRVTLAPSTFAEFLATVDCLAEDAASYGAIRATFEEGRLLDFARSAPPSMLWMNVSVLTEDDRFLALERSAVPDLDKHVWTVGPTEAMKRPLDRDGGEDFDADIFTLAERCLRAEVGLMPEDYGDVFVSWFGYYLPYASPYVVAQVRTRLSAADCSARLLHAADVREHQAHCWLPLDETTVADVIQHWQRDAGGRRWMNRARLAMQELWRTAPFLTSTPTPEPGGH